MNPPARGPVAGASRIVPARPAGPSRQRLRVILGGLALAGLGLAGLGLLASCGTKGPLYLPPPDSDEDNPRQRR
jgi:predicted small lipoprotein YifL